MTKLGIRQAAATDGHFMKAGFVKITGLFFINIGCRHLKIDIGLRVACKIRD
jgi:hypothetical protein